MSGTYRRNYGRGHAYYLDGQRIDGVTTVLDEGFPRPFLIDWAGNATAAFAVDNWAELDGMPIAERLKRIERGRYGASNEAKVRGTDIHRLAERLAAGEEVELTDALAAHAEQFVRLLDEWHAEPVLLESVVINRTYPPYMGTLDAVLRLPWGAQWLVDTKTGKGVYPEVALQLAAYRYAEAYLASGSEELPMPRIDGCAVAHIRADGYDLIPVRAGLEEFRQFRYCQMTARWRAQDREMLGAPLDLAEEQRKAAS